MRSWPAKARLRYVFGFVIVVGERPGADGWGYDKIKADRGDFDASEDNIKKMQKETEEFAKAQHNQK